MSEPLDAELLDTLSPMKMSRGQLVRALERERAKSTERAVEAVKRARTLIAQVPVTNTTREHVRGQTEMKTEALEQIEKALEYAKETPKSPLPAPRQLTDEEILAAAHKAARSLSEDHPIVDLIKLCERQEKERAEAVKVLTGIVDKYNVEAGDGLVELAKKASLDCQVEYDRANALESLLKANGHMEIAQTIIGIFVAACRASTLRAAQHLWNSDGRTANLWTDDRLDEHVLEFYQRFNQAVEVMFVMAPVGKLKPDLKESG